MSEIKLEVNGDCEPATGRTFLEALASAKVMEVTRLDADRFELREQCDLYYAAILTREQLQGLAGELFALTVSAEDFVMKDVYPEQDYRRVSIAKMFDGDPPYTKEQMEEKR